MRHISAPFQTNNSQGTNSVKKPIMRSTLETPPHIRETPYVDYRIFNFKPLEHTSMLAFQNYVGPTPESNWVIPGHLLVGAYPAAIDDNETFFLISQILKLGVTKFVCLQQEYRVDGITEEMWRKGHALRPYFKDVKTIVKSQDKFETFRGHKIVSSEQLSFVHFPIKDCSITDDDGVLELARKLVTSISEGEVIYLHCWGGHGRYYLIIVVSFFKIINL